MLAEHEFQRSPLAKKGHLEGSTLPRFLTNCHTADAGESLNTQNFNLTWSLGVDCVAPVSSSFLDSGCSPIQLGKNFPQNNMGAMVLRAPLPDD